MPEIIKSIEECEDIKEPESAWPKLYAGYRIITNERYITLCIRDVQWCCESYGYITTEHSSCEFSDYIGAELLSIQETDINRIKKDIIWPGNSGYGFDEGEAIFIDLNTDRGTVQFVVYNSHNGYYGHGVKYFIENRKSGDVDMIIDTNI
jgi:hypothetical protein